MFYKVLTLWDAPLAYSFVLFVDNPPEKIAKVEDMKFAILQGRTLPYSMPHPYAYNCAPDHTRSFLAPVRPTEICRDICCVFDRALLGEGLQVRQSNNGEQIFGLPWLVLKACFETSFWITTSLREQRRNMSSMQ